MFATHSMGLARSGADRVYSVQRIRTGESRVTDLERTPRLSEFLGELGFSSYQELGFDKILLVEGVKEVKAFQQLLRLYDKDHEIVLLPLGGGQLINASSDLELAEILRISRNVSAVIDSERSMAGQPLDRGRDEFVKSCERLGIKCHVLDRRAIENYFSDAAVKNVMGVKYRALAPYALLKDAPLSWSKTDNWRIVREMTRDELDQTDLGSFLASL